MTYVITYDSFQSFWPQGQMKPKGSVASFPGPHPASHTAYCTVKWERAWYIFSHEWHHGQDKLCQCGHHINHKQPCPHAHTRVQLFWVEDGSTRRHFYVALHETVGRTEFYQPKTVKTHINNLVVLAHVQFKSFYRLLPVTSLTWENVQGPLPLNHTASDGSWARALLKFSLQTLTSWICA